MADSVIVTVDPDAAGLHLLTELQSFTNILGQDSYTHTWRTGQLDGRKTAGFYVQSISNDPIYVQWCDSQSFLYRFCSELPYGSGRAEFFADPEKVIQDPGSS